MLRCVVWKVLFTFSVLNFLLSL